MKKVLIVLLCFLIILSTSVGCTSQEPCDLDKYVHLDYVSEYNESEHIERIKQRVAKRFDEELENCEIADVYVEIMYAFYDNDPEYFLVEIEYTNEWICTQNGDLTNFKHVIGIIVEDEYFLIGGYYNEFKDGKSSYNYYGYKECKKYFGAGVQAVEKDGELIEIEENTCLKDEIVEYHKTHSVTNIGKVVDENTYYYLMSTNPEHKRNSKKL